MSDPREEGFSSTFKEHLKKNVYDVTWDTFMRRDQSSLSQIERKEIFDKFVKALMILTSITIDTPRMNLSSGVADAVTAWLNNEDWISFGDWLRDYFLNVPIFQNFFLLVRETRTRETWITFQEDYYITIFLPKKPFSNKINRPCLPILEKKVCHRQTTWPLGYAALRGQHLTLCDAFWVKTSLNFCLKT